MVLDVSKSHRSVILSCAKVDNVPFLNRWQLLLMKLYDEKTGLRKIRGEEGVLLFSTAVRNPRMCRLFPPFFLKVIRNEFLVGTREMLLLYVERGPSLREIGKVRRKQCGPWTIEGSLMYLVAREDGNPRVNAK